MAPMHGSDGGQAVRRPVLGADPDEDLEQMQREFLQSSSRPAAQVVRRLQPPAVSGSGLSVGDSAGQQAPGREADAAAKEASGSDMLDFAQRMGEAIKEFEIKERGASAATASAAAASVAKEAPKKMSLFAQRRLAQQSQGSSSSGSAGSDGRTSQGAGPSPAATFLPKLMAPIPEHRPAGPPVPPRPAPRPAGFPEIPTDFPSPRLEPSASSKVGPRGADRLAGTAEGDQLTSVHEQISRENADRISGMTDAEIHQAQDEIRAALSGDAIKRLLSRKQAARDSAPQPPAESEGGDKSGSGRPPKQVRFAADAPGAENSGADEVPPPPPPAEWVDDADAAEPRGFFDVDDNSTGQDGGFYASMRRKQFPSEVVEDAQLAWMLGHQQSKSPMEQAISESRARDSRAAAAAVAASSAEDPLQSPASCLRFAFDGQILEEEDTVPTNAGLHHHGDEPDRAGYTIPELLHLSRSAVPAQRAVTMATLGAIVHKINVGAWDLAQSAEVYAGLLDWQAELYFAHGIADASKTSRAEAVVALWTWVVEAAKHKTLVRLATGGQ
ncbi:hypothetical protein IWQ57_003853, partial [Coemansia nantahalensis]